MNPQEIADSYYRAFETRSDFAEVPMAESLRFVSPAMELPSAEAFRGALRGLVEQFQGMKIRHQSVDGDAVLTVYDFDMGAPGGPIPMAEVLRCSGGEILEVELIFDSVKLRPPA